MPLLTVLTRTFLGRPFGLARCEASVKSQTVPDNIQHLLVVDQERRGIEWTYEHMHLSVPSIKGDYVMLLDDDDYLVEPRLVELLAEKVVGNPAVVMVKMDMGDGRVLPGLTWRAAPELGDVPCSSFIVRRDVFEQHSHDFGHDYGGDANFIKSVWNARHSFVWWDKVVSRVGQVSRGAPETGGANT